MWGFFVGGLGFVCLGFVWLFVVLFVFFFLLVIICAVLYLGCSSRSVHDKLQKHGCFLSQNQSLYFKFVHDCFGVDC